MKIKLLLGLLCCFSLHAQENIQRLDWNGVEVVWLQDERYPSYNMIFYFADGALSDHPSRRGETNAALELLGLGTRRFEQKDISENLEFYGVSYGPHVTHEFATYSFSGLVKDLIPTVKKICHLFDDAVYPQEQMNRERNRAIEGLENMVSNHGELASRAFREFSLKGTPFDFPSSGKIADMKRMTPKTLKEKLEYLNNNVKKRIYVTGPKAVLQAQRVINDECGWKEQKDLFSREVSYEAPKAKTAPEIILVPVPNANQAQVRLGRFLAKNELSGDHLMGLAADFLGGGFTSPLMRELRVMRGLTYSVSAFAGPQKYYGRSGIATFTKNETVADLLNVVKDVIEKNGSGQFLDEQFERVKEGLAGSHPFRFERPMSYLTQLMYLDHEGRDTSELYEFPKRVRSLTKEQMTSEIQKLYDWNQMSIIVIGDKSLEVSLKEFGEVKVVKPETVL